MKLQLLMSNFIAISRRY